MPVFIVDKPLGLSSHDVVARARRALKTKRVGHAGTLDPLASGVLVILSEDATKLSPFLTASDKHYLAWVSFGGSSPTLDAEGPLLEVQDASHLTAADIEAALPAFLALQEQLPPQYSAVKKGGVKAYEAARKGKELTLEPRPVGYRRVALLAFAPKREALPKRFGFSPGTQSWQPQERGLEPVLPEPLGPFPAALMALEVAAGTYIRAFARDLGEALGVSAHLSGLVRTRAGAFGLEAAVTLDELAGATGITNAEALSCPRRTVTSEEERLVLQGKPLALAGAGQVALIANDGHLVAIGEVSEGWFRVTRAWAR